MTQASFERAEPPLRTHGPTNGERLTGSIRRRWWVLRKLHAPTAQRGLRLVLVPLLLIALNPAIAIEAAYAAGPATVAQAPLADFSFESIETVEGVTWDGFVDKPLLLATEIGRPEKELKEKELKEKERLAAERERLRRAQAARRTQAAAPIVTAPEGNGYAYGYCTWWAKVRRPDVPNQWGNANAWLNSARRAGYQTGATPQVGAIVVTAESRLGHVGYVEAIEGDEIIISDMNVVGWSKVSKRHMKVSSGVIRGYIY